MLPNLLPLDTDWTANGGSGYEQLKQLQASYAVPVYARYNNRPYKDTPRSGWESRRAVHCGNLIKSKKGVA